MFRDLMAGLVEDVDEVVGGSDRLAGVGVGLVDAIPQVGEGVEEKGFQFRL